VRILHVLSQLPDQTGSGIYLQSLLREAADRGHTQHVVAAANRDQQVDLPWAHGVQLVRFGSGGLPFELPGMSDVMPYPSTRFADLEGQRLDSYLAAFEEALRWGRKVADPELLHVNHLWLVAALSRRLFSDLPLVASCHGTDLRQAALCPQHAERIFADCRRIDRVLALTPYQAGELERVYGIDPGRIVVTGAGINTRLFGPAERARTGEFQAIADDLGLPVPRSGIRVVYVGKLSAAKGVDSLLDAVELLTAQGRQFSLLLVGSGGAGAEGQRILQRAETLCPPVYALGHREQATVADILRGSHISVLPSFYEGLPLTVMEALVSGCRLVISDLPNLRGWPDPVLVGEDTIVRVPLPQMLAVDTPDPAGLPGYARRLADALARQMDASRYLPLTIQAPALVSELGWDGLFRRIEKIYLETHQQRRGGW
jgi:glycosyltransferase involved in cell wall biosynthesis